MLKDIHYKKTITWTKQCNKGRQEWKYSYIIVRLLVKMFNIRLKTQFASHIIFFQEIFEYRKCYGH
jgi:hypothetical protein